MNLRIVLACLALLAAGYLLVNGGAYTSGPVRKKIELVVATPHGLARGLLTATNRYRPSPRST